MHPDLDQATQAINELHGKHLAACETLRDFLLDMVRPWGGRTLDPRRIEDALLAALLARSSNTFWASIELSRMGFGDQALMLNRSLFEDMVDAHWVTVQPEIAAARYAEHLEHSQMIMAEALGHHRTIIGTEELPVFAEPRRKELDRIFGAFGQRSWTGIALHERVELIEHLWTNEQARDHLHFFRRVVHRVNNQRLHASAEALNRMLRSRSETEVAFRLGPSDESVSQALFGAWWTFLQIVSLIIEHFDFPQEKRQHLDELIADASVFNSLPPEGLVE